MSLTKGSADVAQLVEHSLGKGEVIGSIPIISSSLEVAVRQGGSNSVVESQPSKLLVAGSIPVSRSRIRWLVLPFEKLPVFGFDFLNEFV